MRLFACFKRLARGDKPLPSAPWPTPPTLEERAAQFRLHPVRSLGKGDGTALVWPSAEGAFFSLPFITAYSCGEPVGYIQHASVSLGDKLAVVGHFALVEDLTKRHLGKILARAFRTHLRRRYKIDRIIFRENDLDYWEKPYAKFFRSLGAVPRKNGGMPRPDWYWFRGGAQNGIIPGDDWEGNPPKKEVTPQPPYIPWTNEEPRSE